MTHDRIRKLCRMAPALALLLMLGTLTTAARADEPPAQGRQEAATCPKCNGALPAEGWCGSCNVGRARGVDTTCRSCLTAIQNDGWCDGCRAGYVGAKKTTCRSCFDLMRSPQGGWCDGCNAGHARGLKTTCRSCLTMIQNDGWCAGCRAGYVDGRKTTCRSCFDLMGSAQGGWCDGCKVGHARGLKTTCRSCLTAIQENGWCDGCRAGYVAGRKTTCHGCFDLMSSAQGGWCAGCNVGHARGLRTTCRSCLTAIQQNASCDGCGVRFATVAFKRYSVRVTGLAQAETRGTLEHALAHVGATDLQVDAAQGTASFELDRAREADLTQALTALRERGVEATLAR